MKRLRSEEVVSMEAAAKESSLKKSLSCIKEGKDTLGGGGKATQEYHQFLNLFLDLHANRITIDGLLTRLTDLFPGDKHLILKFNALKSKIQPEDDGSDESPLKKNFSDEANNKIFKTRISKRGGQCPYRVFLDAMAAYREDGDVAAASDDVLYQRVVAVISEKHPDPDLRKKLCNRYLMDFSEQQRDPHDHVDACCGKKTPPNDKIKKKLEHEDAMDFFTRISKCLKYDNDDERAFHLLRDTLGMFKKRQVTASGVYSRVGLILEKYPDLLDEFKDYILSEISEEELRSTPIYLILPAESNKDDDELIIGASDHQQEEVLNNINVCVSAIGDRPEEDRKEYEDLFEDQLWEMDLLLETLISTIDQLKQCLAKVNSVGPLVNIQEHLKPRNLTCIKNVYGARGKDVIDNLKQNPKVALPVVLVRLTQKQKELKKFRSDFKYGMSLNVQRP